MVTFYEITDEGKAGAPVLYLDTLKVSTIEQTAEQAEARGGKGNPPLIIWDYGKEVNVTLEDALFSAKSMAIMFGNGTVNDATGTITKTVSMAQVFAEGTKLYTMLNKHKVELGTGVKWFDEKGNEVSSAPTATDGVISSTTAEFATFGIQAAEIGAIDISANSFPGTYYVTGDTYARSETTGKDEFFQFVIPKAKVQSENTITLEAEGDPSVFNMSLRVLRPADGKMMKLVKYKFDEDEEKALTGAAPGSEFDFTKG